MYPPELEIKDTTEGSTSASCLDLLLSFGRDVQLHTCLYDKRDDFNFHITNFTFLSSNIPSSPAYGVFISQPIRYARASSPYECFILRAVRLSNKLLGQGYAKDIWSRLEGSFMVGTGILSNNMRFPSPECYTAFWRIAIHSDTFHWWDITPIFDPLLVWTLLLNLTFYLIMLGFHRIFATGAVCQQRTLTPPDTWSCPVCKCSFVRTTDTQSYISTPIQDSLPGLTSYRIWLLSSIWHHNFMSRPLIWLLTEFYMNVGFHGASATGVAC